ncbi:MAG TPA: hypothetical protein VGP38_07680, partial [Rubrobacter sp.]|nr:hypothetical protein [Rubrobacter sp.]
MVPRLIAMILFGLMLLAEATQAYGLVRALADPSPVAERLGISPGAEILRAGILLILAVTVALGALLAVVGMLGRRRELFLFGALACAVGYLVHGLYQVASGVLQLGSGGVALSGMIYLALGALAYA